MNTPVAHSARPATITGSHGASVSSAPAAPSAIANASPVAVAVAIDPAPAERRDDRADQVDDEEPAERDGAQAERRRREMERHVGEHRHLREQDAEADGVGRDQLRGCAAGVAERPRAPCTRGDPGCAVPRVPTAATSPARPPPRRSSAASATNDACQLDVGGHQAGDGPAGEAAEQSCRSCTPPCARPACDGGHTSWMYAMVSANMPGVTSPCTKRQKISWCSDVRGRRQRRRHRQRRTPIRR